MTTLHAIQLRYLGPTDYKGARIKLVSLRFEKDSITLGRDYVGSSTEQAVNWLTEHDYTVVAQAESPAGHLLLVDDFKPLRSS